MAERSVNTPDDLISRAVTTRDSGRVPRRGAIIPPHPRSPRGIHIGAKEIAVGAGALATAGAAIAFGANILGQPRQRPNVSPVPGGIFEPSGKPTQKPIDSARPTVTIRPSASAPAETTPSSPPKATAKPTPEATPKPDYTFPGDLESFKNKQIFAKNFFNGPGGGKLTLNIFSGELSKEQDMTYTEIQGLELGAEVVDDHIINYFGVKDGVGNQIFFGVNYGNINSPYSIYLDFPRSSFIDPNIKEGRRIPIKDGLKVLRENIDNAIIFTLWNYTNLPSSNQYVSVEEMEQQNPIALELMNWLLKITKGDYHKIPMSPELEKLINHRVVLFDPAGVPGAYQITPLQKL